MLHFDSNDLMKNFFLRTDSYKVGHWAMYPKTDIHLESYYSCRQGAEFDEIPFFGLQGILKEFFVGEVFNEYMIQQAFPLFKAHFGNDAVFHADGWRTMLKDYGGRLPLRVRALPEGTVIRPGVAPFTVTDTDPHGRFLALTNITETVLLHTWFPMTVAALGRAVLKILIKHLERTGCSKDMIRFMLHDFGFRGTSSLASAAVGGAAHLLGFLGTDTLIGMGYAHDYYGADLETLAYSVPATEHSVMTATGREGEVALVGELLRRFPLGILSTVADSYDIYNYTRNIVGGTYRDEIMARDGVFVVRPDSVTPQHPTPELEMVALCDILWEKFGGTVNQAGFRVIDPHVRLLWGDGIDLHGIDRILQAMGDAGYAACNVATFGMGGGLLQKINRDTECTAIKACAIQGADGVWRDQYKDPLDGSKKSLRGRLKTIKRDGELVTVRLEEPGEDLLQTVFEDGELLIDQNFADIRARAQL